MPTRWRSSSSASRKDVAGEAVLIAAFSGRALAQSARRAGYVPLVADAFGDLDMREAAFAHEVVAGAMETGFRTKPLIAAVDRLVAKAPSPPIGLVLGSGFEDKPRLIAALATRYRLIGNDAQTNADCKDPRRFFSLLDQVGIAHPDTSLTPPEAPDGWLTKRVGGSGGRHIRTCTSASHIRPRRYFQKQVSGERISASAMVVRDGLAMHLTRQWCTPSERQPFRFGGAVSLPHADCEADSVVAMAKVVGQLTQVLGLKGALSFDFVIDSDRAMLLEINARPGASLDVIDTPDGAQFALHLSAFGIGGPQDLGGAEAETARAMAILHADRGPLTLGDIPWPEWSADRGAPGTFVPQGAPLATVFAEAETADAAEAVARRRLAQLGDLIYGHAAK